MPSPNLYYETLSSIFLFYYYPSVLSNAKGLSLGIELLATHYFPAVKSSFKLNTASSQGYPRTQIVTELSP